MHAIRLEAQDDTISRLRTELTQYADKLTQTEHTASEERSLREAISSRVRELENHKQALARQKEEETVRVRFSLMAGLYFAVLFGASAALYRLGSNHKLDFAITGVLSLGWIWLCDRLGKDRAAVRDWKIFDTFHRWKRFLFSVVIVGALIAALGEAAWELIKTIVN